MISDAELPAWLRLLATPGLGRSSLRRLLAAFGSPDAVFDAEPAALRQFIDAAQAAALAKPPDGFDALLERTGRWLASGSAQSPRALLSLADPEYPSPLLQTADPPLLLYLQGRADLLATPSLAIVGSRRPTPQGIDNAREIGAELGRHGLTIVSGLALGIDGAAHLGALDGGAGSIAVVGTGLDIVYPTRHRALAGRLAVEGLLVSEFPLGTPPLSANFPQRNRIIAGISRGTLVVEAAVRSGSLITARLAAEAGREVFAIPGSIRSPQASGCHALIKQGAKLVESAQDVLDELAFPSPPRAADAAVAEQAPEGPLIEALGHDPVTLDALLARTGLGIEALSAALLELELAGKVARLPGQLFQRVGYG
ncbi:DNA-processing protein DprA [Piscinibacter sakaiensis]|uniref:DNA-processing protein DprA n=1 Tax=Piscinibacter sakaiensis TaxID=1547922 RepID=UPI003AAB93DF